MTGLLLAALSVRHRDGTDDVRLDLARKIQGPQVEQEGEVNHRRVTKLEASTQSMFIHSPPRTDGGSCGRGWIGGGVTN